MLGGAAVRGRASEIISNDLCYDIMLYGLHGGIELYGTLLSRMITAQWAGMGDVGSARYEPQ